MAVQAPRRTEVKLIAAIVEKHPKVRFAASRTSAHADLYDRMEQALCERVANAVEVVRSDISPALLVHTGPNLVGVAVQGLSGGGASCPNNAKTSTSAAHLARSVPSFLNALYGGESASYASALLASSAAPRIPCRRRSPGADGGSPCP